jgi:acetyl-CoA C-acetyltransferase
MPARIYPLIETAVRARAGRTPADHAMFMGHLFARYSEVRFHAQTQTHTTCACAPSAVTLTWRMGGQVAARNPKAWTRTVHTAAEIATPTARNRYVVYPYTKLMNAFPTVDQAAALVLTTAGHARALGLRQHHDIPAHDGSPRATVPGRASLSHTHTRCLFVSLCACACVYVCLTQVFRRTGGWFRWAVHT